MEQLPFKAWTGASLRVRIGYRKCERESLKEREEERNERDGGRRQEESRSESSLQTLSSSPLEVSCHSLKQRRNLTFKNLLGMAKSVEALCRLYRWQRNEPRKDKNET